MSRQEALQQFRQALKAGQKCYRECVHRGRYPYPQVLEERLRGCAVAGRVDLGVLDIPIAQIIGTNTAGRQAADMRRLSQWRISICISPGIFTPSAPQITCLPQ